MNDLALKSRATHPSAIVATLEDRVRRLVKPVRVLASGYRILSGENAGDLLAALLTELDETILPRTVKVVTNTNQTLYLDVVNRRLTGIAPANGQAAPGETILSDADAVGRQLRDFFANATKAVVFVSGTEAVSALSETGYTMPVLAAAASLDLEMQAKPDAVEALFAGFANHMEAWITLDQTGNPQKHGGEPAWCRRLNVLALDGLADIDAQLVQSLATPEQPGCIFLNAGGSDGIMLVYARSQNFGFLATIPASEFPEIQTVWKASVS